MCHTYVGGPELLRVLENDAALTANVNSKAGISEMAILFRLLDAYQVTPYVSYDVVRLHGHVDRHAPISDLVRLVVSTRVGLLYRHHL